VGSPRVAVVFRFWQGDKENHGWREGPPATVLSQSFRSAGRAFTLRLNQFRTKTRILLYVVDRKPPQNIGRFKTTSRQPGFVNATPSGEIYRAVPSKCQQRAFNDHPDCLRTSHFTAVISSWFGLDHNGHSYLRQGHRPSGSSRSGATKCAFSSTLRK